MWAVSIELCVCVCVCVWGGSFGLEQENKTMGEGMLEYCSSFFLASIPWNYLFLRLRPRALVQLSSVNQAITEAYTCEQLMKNRWRLTLDSTSLLPSKSLGLLKSYHSAASPWGTKDESLIWVVSEWGEELSVVFWCFVFLLLYFVFLVFFFFFTLFLFFYFWVISIPPMGLEFNPEVKSRTLFWLSPTTPLLIFYLTPVCCS